MTPIETAFLSLLSFSESTSTSPVTKHDGYDVICSGIHGPDSFTDFSDHPFAHGRPPQLVRESPPLRSTASGRYQILLGTWIQYKQGLALKDFSPASQDAVALQIVKEHGGLTHLLAGDIRAAIACCAGTWASLPLSPYGQPTHTMATMLAEWAKLIATP